ncbi:MAG: DUF3179 domain-containing protein [Chloroflexi bacterium]|nr:MAG: DUF3179 domain-containing protein [Chloroflexota bacterium]
MSQQQKQVGTGVIFLFIAAIFGALLVLAQEPPPTPQNNIQHAVPLEDIIFDDFDSPTRALRYSDATPADIERLRDRIRPFCRGEIAACLPIIYESAEDADSWLLDSDQVVGYVAADGQAYAYPFNILNFHEIVNDTLADEPILISYCPLCNSAVVYSRQLNDDVLIFGNTSALYNSDLVMYDQQTDSYWFQVEGRAILGALTGEVLTPLPSFVSRWDDWLAAHPDTLVLARPGNHSRYNRNVFLGYADRINDGGFVYPVEEAVRNDNRLAPAETVLVVQIGDEAKAYPLAQLGNSATYDTVGGQQIVILSRADGRSGAAFIPTLASGETVQLVYDTDSGLWRDEMSGSLFSLSGEAVTGALAGEQLTPLAMRFTYWFAAVAAIPDVEVYRRE